MSKSFDLFASKVWCAILGSVCVLCCDYLITIVSICQLFFRITRGSITASRTCILGQKEKNTNKKLAPGLNHLRIDRETYLSIHRGTCTKHVVVVVVADTQLHGRTSPFGMNPLKAKGFLRKNSITFSLYPAASLSLSPVFFSLSLSMQVCAGE